MENRFENFTYLIIKLSKLVQKIKNIEVREYGLRAIHVMCIYHLSKNTDGLTATELVNLTLEDKAAISRALLLMKEEDIVNYEPKTYGSIIVLSENGKRIAQEILQKANSALAAGGISLSSNDRAVLYKSLMAIEENLEEYYKKLIGDQDEYI